MEIEKTWRWQPDGYEEEIEVEVVIDLLSPGSPGRQGGPPEDCEPPEPPEWDITSFIVQPLVIGGPLNDADVQILRDEFERRFAQEINELADIEYATEPYDPYDGGIDDD